MVKKAFVLGMLVASSLLAENYYDSLYPSWMLDKNKFDVENTTNLNKVYDVKFPLYKIICLNCYTSYRDFIVQYKKTTFSYTLLPLKYKDSVYDNGTSLNFSVYSDFTSLLFGINTSILTKTGDNIKYKQVALNPDFYIFYKNFTINPYFRKDHSAVDKNILYGTNISYYFKNLKSYLKVGFSSDSYKSTTDAQNIKTKHISQYLLAFYNYQYYGDLVTTFGFKTYYIDEKKNYKPISVLIASNYKNFGVYTDVMLGKFSHLNEKSGSVLYDDKVYKQKVIIGFSFKVQSLNINIINYFDKTTSNEKTYGIGLNVNYAY